MAISYLRSALLQVHLNHLVLFLIIASGCNSHGFSCGFKCSTVEIADNHVDHPRVTIGTEPFKLGHQEKNHDPKLLGSSDSLLLKRNVEKERFIDAQITNKLSDPRTLVTKHRRPWTQIHRKLRAISTPACSMADLSITQGLSGYSNGIPAYTVQIVNLCLNPNCQLSNIHVACEEFSSARPLDALVFQRLSYNDCFVMNGAPLRAGESVAFDYANSSEYPMYVISAEVGPCTP